MILIPEEPFDIEEVCSAIRERHEKGRFASIVVVAEGAVPTEGPWPSHQESSTRWPRSVGRDR